MGIALISFREMGTLNTTYWYFCSLSEFLIVLWLLQKIWGLVNVDNVVVLSISFIIFFILLIQYVNKIPGYSTLSGIIDFGHLKLYKFFILGWFFRRKNTWLRYIINQYALSISIVYYFCLIIHPKIDIVSPLMGIVLCLNIAKLLENHEIGDKLVVIGTLTCELYIVHFFFLSKFYDIGEYLLGLTALGRPTAWFSQLLYGIPMTALNVFTSMCVIWVVNKSSILSMVSFGHIYKMKKLIKQ